MWDLRTFAQFQGGKMSSGLFQDFMNGYIKYYDFSVFMFSSSGVMTFVILVEESDRAYCFG